MSAQHFMQRALDLAYQGQYTTRPNPAVGCVIVAYNQIVGEGFHARAGEAHAEIVALQQAGTRAKGATAYVTLEPCSHQGKTGPCADALIQAGIIHVDIAMLDPNPQVNGQGVQRLQAAGVTVKVGLLGEAAQSLNQGFCYSMQHQRPYVRAKLAMSVDGRTAMASGESKWITGEAARQDVQKLRARSGAIVTGIGTVLADDPALTVRFDDTIPAPIRVVCDRDFRIPVSSQLVKTAAQAPVWVFHQADLPEKQAALVDAGVNLFSYKDLPSLFDVLHQHHIHDVLVEAGPTFIGQCIQQQWANELWVYVAPKLMGNYARPLLYLYGLETMADSITMQLHSVEQIEQDVRLIYDCT